MIMPSRHAGPRLSLPGTGSCRAVGGGGRPVRGSRGHLRRHGTVLAELSWSNAAFGPSAFTIYVVVLLIISTVVAWKLPETKGKDLTQLQRCAPAGQRPESLTAPCRPATMSYERIRS